MAKLSDLYVGVGGYWEPTSTGMQTVDQWDGTDTQFSVQAQDAPFEYIWKSSDGSTVEMMRPTDGPFYVAVLFKGKELYKNVPTITGSYWQIRERAGTLYFDVSDDGANWTPLVSYVHSLNLTYLRVLINNQQSGTDSGGHVSGWGVGGFGEGGWGE